MGGEEVSLGLCHDKDQDLILCPLFCSNSKFQRRKLTRDERHFHALISETAMTVPSLPLYAAYKLNQLDDHHDRQNYLENYLNVCDHYANIYFSFSSKRLSLVIRFR